MTPDGRRAVGPHEDDPQSTLKLWDLATGRTLRVLKGHRGPVACFAVSADGRRLLSGSTNGDMGLWELPK